MHFSSIPFYTAFPLVIRFIINPISAHSSLPPAPAQCFVLMPAVRPPVVPEVRQQPRVVVVRERRVVVIETRVTCVNEPNVRWLHEQRQVASDSRHNVVIQQVSQVSHVRRESVG